MHSLGGEGMVQDGASVKDMRQNCRNTEELRLKEDSKGRLIYPPCSSRFTHSQLPRTLSSQLKNISKDGDSTTSLHNLYQCLVTLLVKKCFLMLRRNLLCFGMGPSPLVLSLSTTEKCPFLFSLHPFFGYETHPEVSPG